MSLACQEKEFEEAPQVEDYRPKEFVSNALIAQLQAKDKDLKTITFSALLESANWKDGLWKISADIHTN
uniref:Uncharacterized protein n=1 Tax=Romanomermis culicivorax TaxID=13658 RepID=A0A915I803_ROMCU